ncbi:MAG: hypothetical protein AAF310_05775 [Myxococcota bacterium]
MIFPLVFSIASAYKRRESALQSFGILKSSLASLYLMHRDCTNNDDPQATKQLHLTNRLLTLLPVCLQSSDQEHNRSLQEIYRLFQTFSSLHKQMLQRNVAPPCIAEANTLLHRAIVSFEEMKNIASYHTPATLRAYSRIFLMAFPVLFSPYFANINLANSWVSGYLVAFIYSTVVVSLNNIQDHLENPYDGVGLDDLRLDTASEYTNLLAS